MEMKKYISYFVIAATLLYLLVPVASLRAQTCDPDNLVQVRKGQRGAAVRNLQVCLMELGYSIPAGATGYYGSQTQNAVKQFYRDYLNMSWHGRWIGPQGLRALKSALAQAAPSEEAQAPTTGISADVLAQVLQKIQAGDLQGALALLLSALGAQAPQAPSEQQPSEQQQPSQQPQAPQQPQEGFLVVEQDPSATGVIVREGETANVFGLRFRADNAPVNVKSIFLRWDGSAAPYRVISNLSLVDSQGNTLYSTNVTPSTFYQDSSLNYYLPITGLNINVPVNQYTSVFVRVTVVPTLPSGVNSAGFKVLPNDVRAVDGVGVDRFGPASQIAATFSLQVSLAQSADFVVARNPNTPKEGYIFGNVADGRSTSTVNLLTFDVTAKNDNIRLTEVTITLGNTSNISSVYLKVGNQNLDVRSPSTTVTFNVVPANFVINKDQTVTFNIAADLQNGTATSDAIVTTTVTQVKGQNSLGGIVSRSSLSITSEVLRYRTVGPEVSGFTATTNYQPPSQNASSSYQVTIRFNVTPRGGTIYMGTTTNVTSSFAALELEKADGSTSTPNSGVTVRVYQGSTDVTNSLTVGAGGLFALSENQTYTFEITAAQNGAPIISSSPSTGLWKWVVRNLMWSDGVNSYTMTWTSRDMYTSYTNIQ